MLTPQELRNVFSHDPLTGHIYWRVNSGKRGRSGERAGSVRVGGKVRYMVVRYQGVKYFTHKLVWALESGRWPISEIDHINGDRKDNSIKNLREVTHAENTRNARRRADNKSGMTGVCWNPKKLRWIVQIGKSGTVHQVGGYIDLFEAFCSRKAAEQNLGYHANHGRA